MVHSDHCLTAKIARVIVYGTNPRESREKLERVLPLDGAEVVIVEAELGEAFDGRRHRRLRREGIVASEQHLCGRHELEQGAEGERVRGKCGVVIKAPQLR